MTGAPNPLYVLAFDPSGNVRVRTPIFVGDYLEWKRDGFRGTVWMVVERITPRGDGPAKVGCRPVPGTGSFSTRGRTITRGIHHVYSPDGVDRLSGQKRELPHGGAA